MSSEELFFQKVREVATSYAPEVPASVYSGMRGRYSRRRFFAWNASRMNVWYLAVLFAGFGVACWSFSTNSSPAAKAVSTPVVASPVRVPASAESITHSCEVQATPALVSASCLKIKKETSQREGAEPTEVTVITGGIPEPVLVSAETLEAAGEPAVGEGTDSGDSSTEAQHERAPDKNKRRKLKTTVLKDKQ